MKCGEYGVGAERRASHPSRGAWIEIAPVVGVGVVVWSHPSRGAWIEIGLLCGARLRGRSHPSRGAWIEIDGRTTLCRGCAVAPLTGCVD